ncbi:MAG: glycosyltransferase [Verrucomicrobiales bacterium]|nr:glycosyltransferase [Verrucomicrobiales bacterium]
MATSATGSGGSTAREAQGVGGVLTLVHGGPASVEIQRAQGLASSLSHGRVRIIGREGSRGSTALLWWRILRETSPSLVYVINTAMPGGWLVPWWSRRHRVPYILDTGDLVYEMALESGVGAGWKLPLLKRVESMAQGRAAAIVVRGTRHRELLMERGYRRVELIRDGYVESGPVDADQVASIRERLGLDGRFVVGVLGSTVLSPRLQICYGWDLLRALARLGDLPVTGLIVGDGDGLPWLRSEARRLGVEDRVRFAGRIPYADVQPMLRVFDIALSTQTNNRPGRVRTTGKLPEYMAAGRFIVASRVGEAELLLPEPMLLDYEGAVDWGYPDRLAARIREVFHDPTLRQLGATLPAKASALCRYEVLSRQFKALVHALSPRAVAEGGAA